MAHPTHTPTHIIPLAQTESSHYHVNVAHGTASLNHGVERTVVDLSNLDWRFACGRGDADILDPQTAVAPDFDDSSWQQVTLPHTWNAIDTNDGVRGNMNRTVGWYRAHLHISKTINQRTYLEFDGVNSITCVYVNGRALTPLGTDPQDTARDTGDPAHLGGYAMFRYDLTNILNDNTNADTVIAVRVDNRRDLRVAPLFADFNFYGGIYRPARLVQTADVHLALDDHGASGLRIVTPNAGRRDGNNPDANGRPDHLGLTEVSATIVNNSDLLRRVFVVTTITDRDGHVAAGDTISLEIAPHTSVPVHRTLEVSDPHLWQPINYSRGADNSDVAYQYDVRVAILDTDTTRAARDTTATADSATDSPAPGTPFDTTLGTPFGTTLGTPLDSVSEKIGYRWFHVDKTRGFFINGHSHPLRGVTRHQDRELIGNALHDAHHLEDFTIITQMGVNYLRLAHYPHANYFYDLCDANGIIVWAEIPFIDWVGEDERFADVTKEQLVELIRQQGNRPSICFWGLQNEVGNHNTANQWIAMPQLSRELNDLAHAEDPTRYTTQAADQDETASERDNWASDIISWNMYPGWYSQPGFGALIEQKRSIERRPLGLSEYGTGASIDQHELHPNAHKTRPNSYWQPEEYQSLQHEEALAYINTHDWLWSTSLWNMFDFGVDHRPSEAGRFEINNKGLVTWDRAVKKDAFYLHKANWNHLDPFVYIASRRYVARAEGPSTVRVYSNLDRVWLLVSHNGDAQVSYDAVAQGNGIFTVDGLLDETGTYTIWAYGTYDTADLSDHTTDTTVWADHVIWTRLGTDDRVNGGRLAGSLATDNGTDNAADSDTDANDGRARIDGTAIPWSLWPRPDSGFSLDRDNHRMIADRPLHEITPEQWRAAFSFNGSGVIDYYATLPTGLTTNDKAIVTAADGTQTVFTLEEHEERTA
ncbi:Glycosyl hydrolases family 2, TIM barrel domain-containing protein [Bifidobacterium hapali]|uniref:Glycosyl hydrolases family 2, TIM barrel domain-containing protein n=1 Tax=Bifidobacterium hapali TaxID=1630172 RepID=A0A261FUF4_9BIFI|nr:glycoside hydrolase family 2 TIM barrel-domain containing protein [Bifidobacterium hapali]OZG62573.1 Glycosyl hydrolases family 2, TIM barrel domain-containing protein [Bifidobacterium hapali]